MNYYARTRACGFWKAILQHENTHGFKTQINVKHIFNSGIISLTQSLQVSI